MNKSRGTSRTTQRRSRKSTAVRGGGYEPFYDALPREGILGGGKGLPRDLSTNPKYMEGFGESARKRGRRKTSRRSAKRK